MIMMLGPVQITLLTSILGFLNPYTRMGGTELIYSLFRECPTGAGHKNSGLCVNPVSSSHVRGVIESILATMMVKAVLTVITFGIRLPAGIFIPTLGVGACAGRIIGIGMQWVQARYPDIALFSACKGDADCKLNCRY
jgi:chloride channel 3/4/5